MELEYICNDCGEEITSSEYEKIGGSFCPSCNGRIEENTEKIWCYTDRYLRLIGPLYVKDLKNDYIDKKISKKTKILNIKINEWRPLLEWKLFTSVYEQFTDTSKSKQWHYKNCDGELTGPFSSDELKLAYKRHEINNNTDILHKGNMLWRKLSSWTELKSVYSNDTKLFSRKLCSDGSCIGVIGDNDNCKVCGKKYEEKNVVGYNQPVSLIKCETCSQQFSKRAEKCPKCGWHPLATCQVCSRQIPNNSETCPECGDPVPFGQHSKDKLLITSASGSPPPLNNEITNDAASLRHSGISINNKEESNSEKTIKSSHKGYKWALNVFYMAIFYGLFKSIFGLAGKDPGATVAMALLGAIVVMVIFCPIAFILGYFQKTK